MRANSIHVSGGWVIVNSQPKTRHRWVMASWAGEATPRSREARGHQKRGDAVVQASLPCTSLALNASVQLCTDFFLRTSCGSHNNDSRALPPLSRLKYGNCIIQVQGPLFSHGWDVAGTISHWELSLMSKSNVWSFSDYSGLTWLDFSGVVGHSKS